MHDIWCFQSIDYPKIHVFCLRVTLLPFCLLYHRGGLPDWLAAAGQALAWPGMLATAWTCRARADAHTAARTTLLRGHNLHRRCLSLRRCAFLYKQQGTLGASAMFSTFLYTFTKERYEFKSYNSHPRQTLPATKLLVQR